MARSKSRRDFALSLFAHSFAKAKSVPVRKKRSIKANCRDEKWSAKGKFGMLKAGGGEGGNLFAWAISLK